jgi:hypothetical protein
MQFSHITEMAWRDYLIISNQIGAHAYIFTYTSFLDIYKQDLAIYQYKLIRRLVLHAESFILS